jgi:glucose-1-phosphate thymidylyltransferase
VEEKPKVPPSELAITGLYGFSPGFFGAIGRTKPGLGGELQITDAIAGFLLEEPEVYGEVYRGLWADVGRPAALLEANRGLLKGLRRAIHPTAQIAGGRLPGRVEIGEGSHVEDCAFRGPVLVGQRCQLVRTRIKGPCTIGDDAVIVDSVLSNCLVDRRARIEGLRRGLRDSIIGIGAEVKGGTKQAAVEGMVVGDGWRVPFE